VILLLASVDELGQTPCTGSTRRAHAGEARCGGAVEAFSAGRERVVYARADLAGPAELYSVALRGGQPVRLTDANHEPLASRHMGEFEQFSFKGWNDETVYGYVVKPYGFRARRAIPDRVRGARRPQVSFGSLWTYRWNAQDFRRRWLCGGDDRLSRLARLRPGVHRFHQPRLGRQTPHRPAEGTRGAIEKTPWLDGERACALGPPTAASMMNWIEGALAGSLSAASSITTACSTSA